MRPSTFRRAHGGSDKRPVAIDLFSGCGGLTLGLKQAGFRVVGAIEIDPLAAETYRRNHKGVKVWQADIRDVSAVAVRRRLGLGKGVLDLLAGCPPCQGFSMMRTLNGAREVKDPRNDLVFEFLRFVRDLKPKAIMMENVPGLATDPRMGQLLREMAKLGYYVDDAVRVLGVAKYGVPQRRRRMLLLTGRFGPVDFALADPNCPKVRDRIDGLPPAGRSGDPLHDFPEKRSPRIMEFIKSIPRDGGGRLDLDQDRQLTCHRNCDGFKDVYGRMAWESLAPTITGGCTNPSKGRFLHPDQDRAITLREAALLQTFPRDYHFSLRRGKLAAAVLIGNALPPEFVRRHAVGVARYISRHRDGGGDHVGCDG